MTNTRGGNRRGAGRKPLYGEKTVMIGFRVPISLSLEITKYVNNKLKKHRK